MTTITCLLVCLGLFSLWQLPVCSACGFKGVLSSPVSDEVESVGSNATFNCSVSCSYSGSIWWHVKEEGDERILIIRRSKPNDGIWILDELTSCSSSECRINTLVINITARRKGIVVQCEAHEASLISCDSSTGCISQNYYSRLAGVHVLTPGDSSQEPTTIPSPSPTSPPPSSQFIHTVTETSTVTQYITLTPTPTAVTCPPQVNEVPRTNQDPEWPSTVSSSCNRTTITAVSVILTSILTALLATL